MHMDLDLRAPGGLERACVVPQAAATLYVASVWVTPNIVYAERSALMWLHRTVSTADLPVAPPPAVLTRLQRQWPVSIRPGSNLERLQQITRARAPTGDRCANASSDATAHQGQLESTLRFEPYVWGRLGAADSTRGVGTLLPEVVLQRRDGGGRANATTVRHVMPRGFPAGIGGAARARAVASAASNKEGWLCLAGSSHVRHVCALIAGCRFVESRVVSEPRVVLAELLRRGRLCNRLVLSFGQWDGSYRHAPPTPPAQFGAAVREVLGRLHLLLRSQQRWLMTTNDIPMGCAALACPPAEWRTPPLIGAYNAELEAAARAAQIGFIDNRDIIGPVWDSALDWNHPDGRPFEAMAAAVIRACSP